MKPKKSFIIFLLAIALTPFAPSIRTLYQKVTEELDATYAKAAAASQPNPGFPLAAGSSTIAVAIQPFVAEAAPAPSPVSVPAPAPVSAPPPAQIQPATAPDSLGQLVIPSINLDVAIGSVGLTATGNMGVINNPTEVSWYKGGTVPGNIGSAVIGAHVFQAFAKLKDVKLGDSIYIDHEDGSQLHFVVTEIEVYPYTDAAPLQKIFDRSDTARLNLITCSGALTTDHATYDHRLVIFAELADST